MDGLILPFVNYGWIWLLTLSGRKLWLCFILRSTVPALKLESSCPDGRLSPCPSLTMAPETLLGTSWGHFLTCSVVLGLQTCSFWSWPGSGSLWPSPISMFFSFSWSLFLSSSSGNESMNFATESPAVLGWGFKCEGFGERIH